VAVRLMEGLAKQLKKPPEISSKIEATEEE